MWNSRGRFNFLSVIFFHLCNFRKVVVFHKLTEISPIYFSYMCINQNYYCLFQQSVKRFANKYTYSMLAITQYLYLDITQYMNKTLRLVINITLSICQQWTANVGNVNVSQLTSLSTIGNFSKLKIICCLKLYKVWSSIPVWNDKHHL